jgi:hypothetical protein
MSTLQCTNLQDTSGGNSLTTAQIYNGAAKAWVNFNGMGTVAIRAQFNVSSITDNGTGDYTVNFTTAMTDTNYAVVTGAQNYGTNTNTATNIHQGATPTTSAFRLQHIENSVVADASQLAVAIFR